MSIAGLTENAQRRGSILGLAQQGSTARRTSNAGVAGVRSSVSMARRGSVAGALASRRGSIAHRVKR